MQQKSRRAVQQRFGLVCLLHLCNIRRITASYRGGMNLRICLFPKYARGLKHCDNILFSLRSFSENLSNQVIASLSCEGTYLWVDQRNCFVGKGSIARSGGFRRWRVQEQRNLEGRRGAIIRKRHRRHTTF